MSELSQFLSPLRVSIDDLLLDPNNPRFSEIGEELITVPESRYADEKVQQNAYEKMRNPLFDVSELKDTIKTLGFLPMDRIVIRKWKGVLKNRKTKYVVLEGNRRVTALKWLLTLHDKGKETFTREQLKNFKNIECLILDDQLAPVTASLILPGLRHVSGIKEWGAYQKAKAIYELRRSGLSPQEAAQNLGLSTRSANQAYRCFRALEQMKTDEEFGEFVKPKLYSYFEESFKRPNVKKWLGWDDHSEEFQNEEHLKEFYSWIVPQDGERDPKLSEAKSIRDLGRFIDDEGALNIFRLPDGSVARALAKYEIDHPEDWFPKIIAAANAIKSLTPEMLRKMNDTSQTSLHELKIIIEQTLSDREKLLN